MDLVINGRFLTQLVTGVQRYARELVQALDAVLDARREVRATVVAPRGAQAPNWRNIDFRQVGTLQGHAWEQLDLPRFCRGKALFCPGNTAPVVSLLSRDPVVVTVHDLSYRYFPEAYSRAFRLWYGLLIPLVLRRAAAVITVSESERAAMVALYPEAATRLRAIQNGGWGADFGGAPADVASSDRAAGDSGYVLYVGSLSRRKNFPAIVEAATHLARKRRFRFVIVGGVAGGIADTGLGIPSDVAPYITFAGHVNDAPMLASYYRRAACLLFPSFYEASPLPPIEAMACGCVVVASDIPSLRERCGDAALYCDPSDGSSITAAVERVMDEPALRAQLAAAGQRRAAAFTWQRCAQDTLDVICNSLQSSDIDK